MLVHRVCNPTPWLAFVVVVLASVGCDGTSPTPGNTGTPATGVARPAPPIAAKVSRPAPVKFLDVADRSGVRFTYRDGQEAEHFAILESLGGGVGLADIDRDGNLDLLPAGGGSFGEAKEILGLSPRLFRNDGAWTFEDRTLAARIDLPRFYNHGIAVADYDDDGFPDVLVTGYGGLVLHRNQGDGTFVEVTQAAGLTDALWSSSAAWGDINGDGRLDLYVAHYVNWSFENHPKCPGPTRDNPVEVCPPRYFEGLPDVIYFSRGDGTFVEASQDAGLRKDGKGLGVVVADVDLDGDVDVYVTNDTVPSFLYQNDGSGHLEEIGLISGTALGDKGIPNGSMGVDVADFNLDGRPDIWVVNYEQESIALYRNEGRGFFLHVSQAAGITSVGGLYVGWGTAFFDMDHDGDEDAFVSNGHVIRFPVNTTVDQAPLLFENLTGGRFENVAPTAGDYFTSQHRGRGVAAGDLDNDGDIDLAVSRVNQPVAVLQCEGAPKNHWLTLQLVGTSSNRDAFGAQVRLHTSQGMQLRLTKGGSSYASSHDPRVNFGLGADERAAKIEIRWPSGITQELLDVPADQILLVQEPAR
jgi:hypothetical protein